MIKKISALLLMGGSGDRFGSSMPKQFHRLSGKPIYLHTLEKFLRVDLFHEVILVCHPDWMEHVKQEIPAIVRLVAAGSTRQESSSRGLHACDPTTTHVVIHDVVRPFVSETILHANIEALARYPAVDTCIPSADTIVHSKEGDAITAIPKRAEYLRGQTPQSFTYPLILAAHKNTERVNASDDCQLMLEQGHTIGIVFGDEHNIKITTELDLFIAEQLFRIKTPITIENHTQSLAGKRYALLGGTGGIGSAIAAALEKEGALPIIISPSAPEFPTDLSKPENVHALFTQIGAVDGLINAMGLLHAGEVEALSISQIEAMVGINLTAMIYSCKAAIIKPGGHLINIASSSYFRGRKGTAVYSATKAAVVNFTQALAEERPDLLVNALLPSRTHTPLRTENFPEEDPSTLLSPSQVATAILNLLKQSHLTGALIEVK